MLPAPIFGLIRTGQSPCREPLSRIIQTPSEVNKLRVKPIRTILRLLTEADSAGIYHSPGWDKGYARLQIFTIADSLAGAEVKTPSASITFKQAEKVKSSEAEQKKLLNRHRRS